MQPIHHEAAIKPIGFNPQIRIKKTIRLIGFVVITGLLLVLNAKGQTLPTGFSQVLVTNEISKPTLMAFAPDGRLFISQQTGELRIVKNGSLLAQPFISLSVYSSGERGLLGVAFDPNFTSNHYLYLYYTLPSGANNRISRFTANGDVVVTGSEVPILDLDPIGSSLLHFAGDMKFGPDGKLYVSTGDDVHGSNSQNLDSYHGKILRINPDGSVPAGNPYTSGSNQKLRVWASGLRNPYTLNFQPGTGRLFVNDVGEVTWEEINEATTGGKNFGWPAAEGTSSNTAYTNPVYKYAHGTGSGLGCAVTGGAFFNPTSTNYPSTYIGKYFYIDYCNRWIDMITVSGSTVSRSNFATGLAKYAVTLATGTDGNLYYLSRDENALYKIIYTTTFYPVITRQPQSISVSLQKPATFSVYATGIAPLTYQWRKNGITISGATSASYTIASVSDASAGKYSVVITNAYGRATSNDATLTVTPFNYDPQATIIAPVAGTTYAAGTVVTFSGSGKDTEDGQLPAAAFEWYVMFHHISHTHPGPYAPSGVTGGSFSIPNIGETSPNVFYRLYLVVRDAGGAKDTTYIDIKPRTSTITLNTNPQGLQITLDGQPFIAPYTLISVEGMLRTLGVVSPQTINSYYTFRYNNWSQGGVQTQTIATPVSNVTYTANFYYLKVNFQDSATIPPLKWLRDFGQPLARRTSPYQGTGNTYGWIKRSDRTVLNLTLNGRKRTIPSDILLATLMFMQANNVTSSGLTHIEGMWEAKVPDGKYTTTVTVGDGVYLNSNHTINVEGVNAINNFVQTTDTMFKSATVTTYVNDGLLTVDAIGGFNTKINTVIIQPSVSVITLKPVADAYVGGGINANTNYGSNIYLTVRRGTTDLYRRSYLKFSLSNVSTVRSAMIRLYGYNKQSSASIKITASGVDDDSWTESGITLNNAPAVSTTPLPGFAYVNDVAKYGEYDVTAFVKKQVAGDKVVSFLIDEGAQDYLLFNSKESSQNIPQLVLITDTPAPKSLSSVQHAETQQNIVIHTLSLQLNPNPVSNTLQVYIKGLQENKLSTVSILNADGVVLKTIYTSSINQSLQLNVASLATGIFTIKIISGDKIMYKQFVKM